MKSMAALQIYDPRERAIVAAADAVLGAAAGIAGWLRRRRRPPAPKRILLLRLERIGDLLMAAPATADVRAAAPDAEIDLVVGSWNASVARHLRGVTRVIVADAAWLARGTAGATMPSLVRMAGSWRRRRYDLAINFEPDIRSNLLIALAGAQWTAGYASAGGGPLLDEALDYRPGDHTVDNARRLVATVFGRSAVADHGPLLTIPDEHRDRAAAWLQGRSGPIVAVHVPGGRLVKQWDPNRFASVAASLAQSRGATIALTGTADDRTLIDPVRAALPADRVVDLTGVSDLLTVGAVLRQCDLVITGDTGPMHIAAAVGTPIVAVFGPSDPRRYAPRGSDDRIVRVDLPCAPCNRIRLPPARCTGRTPDCLALVAADQVLAAALGVLDRRTAAPRGPSL